MLRHQVAVYQHVEGIINRSTADLIVLIFHRDVQLVDVEMVGAVVNLFKYGEAFGGFSQAFPFKVGQENHPRRF